MPKDNKEERTYPKLSDEDTRWKQQEEFDAAGPLREQEDQEKNESIKQAKNSTDSDSDSQAS